jgi:hypothetical protein
LRITSRRAVPIDGRGVGEVLAVGALAPPTPWLDSSAPPSLWLVEPVDVDEPVDSVSAAAIAPPALPMRRPVVSTQTPAAWRRCVEIMVSSHQNDLVGRFIDAHCRTVTGISYTDSAVNLGGDNRQHNSFARASIKFICASRLVPHRGRGVTLGCGLAGKVFEPVRRHGRGFGGQDEERESRGSAGNSIPS